MFEGLEPIVAQDDATGEGGLRRVGWAELTAAISLSRNLRGGEQGLLAQAGGLAACLQRNSTRTSLPLT